MFFNMDTGEIFRNGNGQFTCWVADGNIWFTTGECELTIHPGKRNWEKFCKWLEQAADTKEYTELKFRSHYYALEDEDEGRRNFIMASNNWALLSIKVRYLRSLALFLRSQRNQ